MAYFAYFVHFRHDKNPVWSLDGENQRQNVLCFFQIYPVHITYAPNRTWCDIGRLEIASVTMIMCFYYCNVLTI